jgi:hypothetical protein
MQRTLNRSVVGALLFLALAVPGGASAAGPPKVFVRIEGATKTVLSQTSVQTTTATQVKGSPCSGSSVAGALDVATHGHWSGTFSTNSFGSDFFVKTILGETPSGNDFWDLWVNGQASTTGACLTAPPLLSTGDRVLWFHCVADASFNCTNNPLSLTAPASARAGRKLTVSVVQLDGAGRSKPFAGATVSGAGVTVVTGSAGRATFVPKVAGTLVLQARRTGATPSDPVTVCVYATLDGACGTADKDGPPVSVSGISEHEVFTHGPRNLRGTAGPDPSGLRDVRLSLVRHAFGGGCSYFDAARGTWHATKCHRTTPTPSFSVGARASWSYLLPEALPPGDYRLDVVARDGNGRLTKIVTGVSGIDFKVPVSLHG